MQISLGKTKVSAKIQGFNRFVYTLSMRDFMTRAGKPVVLQAEFINSES